MKTTANNLFVIIGPDGRFYNGKHWVDSLYVAMVYTVDEKLGFDLPDGGAWRILISAVQTASKNTTNVKIRR